LQLQAFDTIFNVMKILTILIVSEHNLKREDVIQVLLLLYRPIQL